MKKSEKHNLIMAVIVLIVAGYLAVNVLHIPLSAANGFILSAGPITALPGHTISSSDVRCCQVKFTITRASPGGQIWVQWGINNGTNWNQQGSTLIANSTGGANLSWSTYVYPGAWYRALDLKTGAFSPIIYLSQAGGSTTVTTSAGSTTTSFTTATTTIPYANCNTCQFGSYFGSSSPTLWYCWANQQQTVQGSICTYTGAGSSTSTTITGTTTVPTTTIPQGYCSVNCQNVLSPFINPIIAYLNAQFNLNWSYWS